MESRCPAEAKLPKSLRARNSLSLGTTGHSLFNKSSCKSSPPPSPKTNPYSQYYASLGLDPNTPFPDIRAAYLTLAKQYNPKLETNIAKFMEITEAFQILKKKLQSDCHEGACNFSTRLNRVFEKVFAVTAESEVTGAPVQEQVTTTRKL